MAHHVDLNNACIYRPAKHFPQQLGKNFRNRIDALALNGVGTDQRWCAHAQQFLQSVRFFQTECIHHQIGGGIVVTRFRSFVGRVLFDGRFCRVNHDIRKRAPCGARWVKGDRHGQNSPTTAHLPLRWFGKGVVAARSGLKFHPGQKQAILNAIVAHEVLGAASLQAISL